MELKQVEFLEEEKVFMLEEEADFILARMYGIASLYGLNKGKELEWFYLYDLEKEDSVIGFVTDEDHQVDVVQINGGTGYAYNFWKGNYFQGQIIVNNSWNVVDAILE